MSEAWMDEALEEKAGAMDFEERRVTYKEAKAAKAGAKVTCPNCWETFTKRSPAQAFCSNPRKPWHGYRKGQTRDCKTQFWNRLRMFCEEAE